MIHKEKINGVSVETGDIICTKNGSGAIGVGQIWWFIGKLVYGAVDHVAIYIGPNGKCVEASAKLKVIEFHVPNKKWVAKKMTGERGPIYDTFYGVSYPLKGGNYSKAEEKRIRESVANYCVEQAKAEKPYNLNFFDSKTTSKFYCSQLAWRAYQREGIDLNKGAGVPDLPGTKSIIFPQELWSECEHTKAKK